MDLLGLIVLYQNVSMTVQIEDIVTMELVVVFQDSKDLIALSFLALMIVIIKVIV